MSYDQLILWIIAKWFGVGYLLGSVPFGLLLAKLMGLGNLREIGSGNIGATNVLRTGNKLAAALTLLLDGGKGALAVLLGASVSGGDLGLIAGLGAMIGHCYPIWLRFAGGKGVATFLGIILAMNVWIGLGACVAWLIGAFTTRISSIGALVAAMAAILLAAALDGPTATVTITTAMSLLIFWRHRANIRRVLSGTEPKIGQKS